jgi:hypothetical protein
LLACVQNHYNVAHRHDDALIDSLAGDRIAYVPFSRSADSHRFSHPRYRVWRRVLARRQCKSRSHGCFAVPQTFSSFRARRRWRIFERTSRQRSSICRTKRSNG